MAERIMPKIDRERCTLCGDCVEACPNDALSLERERGIVLDEEACAYCGDCEDVCPLGAISLPYDIRLGDVASTHPA
jgi:formate hydrogenlyase subunit 6/NADH:ubiquinone oxidoreductase subunit I